MGVCIIDFEPGLIYPPNIIGYGKLKVDNKLIKAAAIDSQHLNVLKEFYSSTNQNITFKENQFSEEVLFVQNEKTPNEVSIPIKTFITVTANAQT